MASICELSYLVPTNSVVCSNKTWKNNNNKSKRKTFVVPTNIHWPHENNATDMNAHFKIIKSKWHSKRNLNAFEIIFHLSVLMFSCLYRHFFPCSILQVNKIDFLSWTNSTLNVHQWSLATFIINIYMKDYNNYVHVSFNNKTRRG